MGFWQKKLPKNQGFTEQKPQFIVKLGLRAFLNQKQPRKTDPAGMNLGYKKSYNNELRSAGRKSRITFGRTD
jgi:hypothetical protein